MSDDLGGHAVDAAPVVESAPPITQEHLTASDAARLLASMRGQKEQPAESAEQPATADPELAEEANASPEEATGEEPEASEAETPPIEPPRSWTKEAKERWASLPRDTQEYLAQREEERDRGLNRSQTELAEQRKAIEAERDAMAKVKSEYEGKLPALMQALHDVNNQQFADIRTQADLDKLAVEDPFRWIQFQTHQQRMQAVQQELQKAEQQKTTESQTKWNNHVQEESAKFVEMLSDADKGKIKEIAAAAPEFLEGKGFTPQELADLASGKDKLSIYDRRVQSLILDGMKYRDLQKAPPKAAPKTLPPVQKPGAAQPRGAANAQNIQALNAKLSASGRLEDAMALLHAQRAS